jgi:hypothetical protein
VARADSEGTSCAGVWRLELDGSTNFSDPRRRLPVYSNAFERGWLCSVTEISGLLSSS